MDMSGIMPVPDTETVWQLIFALTYIPHGGSGMSLTGQYVESMSWDHAVWTANRLTEQREAEAEAIEGASNGGEDKVRYADPSKIPETL